MPSWRLFAGGVYLRQRLHLRADSTDPTGTAAAGDDPPAQWQVRSSFDLPRNVELDFSVRHVGALPSPEVPAYTAVDARIGWRVQPGLELSVVGENLFDPAHVEFGSIANGSAIPRTVFFKVVWTL
jgi:iron complex outermembrane receptor protein